MYVIVHNVYKMFVMHTGLAEKLSDRNCAWSLCRTTSRIILSCSRSATQEQEQAFMNKNRNKDHGTRERAGSDYTVED